MNLSTSLLSLTLKALKMKSAESANTADPDKAANGELIRAFSGFKAFLYILIGGFS